MEHFYIYSFTLAVIPLLLGLLFIWFGKKLWDNATKKNEVEITEVRKNDRYTETNRIEYKEEIRKK